MVGNPRSVVVVYVHGLWQTGREGFLLRRRLARSLGAQMLAFSYPSMSSDVTTNSRALGEYLAGVRAGTLHLIGHSLGGLVILRMFELGAPALPPGRIVLMGSPIRGSLTARRLAGWGWGRRVIGRGLGEQALGTRERRWCGTREIGVVAGTSSVGLGRLVGGLGAPGDGTVRVDETRLEGAADSVSLRVSHTGMVFSAAVARQAAAFLRTGRFER